MAKAYTEARKQHGESELLDEVVSAKPKADRSRHGSYEELKEHGRGQLRETVTTVESKASPEEVEDYKRFVLSLVERPVSSARREPS